MKCSYCSYELGNSDYCTNCGKNNGLLNDLNELSSICYNDALDLINQNHISKAIDLLHKAIQINSKNLDAVNLLGLCYFKIGKYTDALNEWIYSVNISKDNNIATKYINDIDKGNHIKEIRQAIEIYNKSIDFIQENNEKYAILQLKKAIKIMPDMIDAHLLLTVLFIQARNYNDAYKSVKKALYLDSANKDALRYLSEIERHVLKNSKKEDIEINEDRQTKRRFLPKSFNNISIGSRILNIVIGFVIGIFFMLVLAFPAMKSSQIDSNKNVYVEKNQEIFDLQKKLEEANTKQTELTGKLEDAEKLMNDENSDKGAIQAAIYNSALSRYEKEEYIECKKECELAIRYGSSDEQLYILLLRATLNGVGIQAGEQVLESIKEKFKDQPIVQEATIIVEATKNMFNGN